MNANGQLATIGTSSFDDITSLAAGICQVPVAMISFQAEGRLEFKSAFGLADDSLPSPESLGRFFDLFTGDLFLIPDAKADARFASNPLMQGELALVFCASVILKSSSGQAIGRLSVFDQAPRNLAPPQLEALRQLAKQAENLIALEESKQELKHTREKFQEEKNRLFKIIDAADVGIWEMGLDDEDFVYNEKWASIIGFSASDLGEINRETRKSLVHPADRAESERMLGDYLAGILPRYECELRMRHKNGYWVWVLERGELTGAADDQPKRRLYGTLSDNSEHVVAYEQIYLREKKFKILLENSEDAIAILNETGTPHFETESVSKILGLKSIKGPHESIRTLIHPEDLEGFDVWFQKSLLAPGKAIQGNISRFKHWDGSWRYLSGTLTNLLHDPIIHGLIHNFKDVTEQVLAEQLRQKTENRYRKLAQEGADLVSVLSHEGAYSYISPSFSAYVGFTAEELEGQGVFDLVHPDDVERVRADFQFLLEMKNVRIAPFRFRHQREGWRWVQSVATNLLDDADIQGIVMNSVDVTAVIEAKDELEESNESFRLVLKAGSESIYYYDAETHEIVLSDTFEETFGIQVDKQEGEFKQIYDRIHPDDLVRSIDEFRDALLDPGISVWTREYRLLKGDGTYANIRDRCIKVMDPSGKPIRVVGALMDISKIYFFQKLLEIEKKFIESSLIDGTQEEELYRKYLTDLESLIPGMRSSLSRVVDGRLVDAISPSLPPELISAIEGLPIGVNQGSCGTAAFLNEKVFATDIFKDPRWQNHLELARNFGIGACWSFPITDLEGRVVATVANYYFTTKEIEEKELQALERAHRLISLLMAQYNHLEKIRLSSERYEMVNKTTNEAIFDWDVQKDKFYWGESLQRVFGHDYLDGDFNLEKWISLMHPEDNLEKAEEWGKFLDNRMAHKWQNQFRFLKADGSFAFVEESAYIIRDEQGDPVRMIGVLRDSTPLKKMETLLANASKIARVGGWDLDLINDRQLWSPITCEIHEVPVDFKASASRGISFYRKDYHKKVNSMVALAVKTGEKFDFEAPIITAKGNERWVRSIGEAEFLNGKCIRLFGSIQDIHERKLMEERLKGVSDSIPGVIFQYILKPDGTDQFRYVSKGSVQFLGLTPEECMEDSDLVWSRMAHGGDLDLVKKSVEDSAATLGVWNCEWKVLNPEGKLQWREGIGKPNRRVDGTIVWDALVMDVTDRKNLENLLEQSTRMAKIGSWELDLTNVSPILNWSSSTRVILGFDKLSGIKLEKVYESFLGESQEIAKQCLENLFQKGTGFDVELEVIAAGGKSKWVRCIGQAVFVKGRTLSAFGSIQDIHERKLSELNLKRLLLERNTILESIADGFFAVDTDYVVTYWNKQAENLLRQPREEIVGKNLWDIFKAQDTGVFRENFQQAIQTGQAVYFEDYLEEFEVWFSVSAFPSESGLTVYFKDITANKKAQEEIRKSNDRFERVSEATNDAIWDYQIPEAKLYWGRGFRTLFGYQLDEFDPDPSSLINLVHKKDRKRIGATFQKAKGDPENYYWNEEYRFQKEDGTFAFVKNRAVFSRNTDGQAVRVIGAISDITEQKEFEASLKKLNTNLTRQTKELAVSNAELEQFAYVASHDLQEPLRMVSSFLSMLDRKYSDQFDEKAQRYVHFAVNGAIRMRQIILDLLEYSRVGKEEMALENVNFEEVIFEVTQLQAKLIKEKKALIQIEGHAVLICSRSPILQVFQNLIGNALKYSREDVPPLVLITCTEEKDQWLFSVKDNGIGIKEEYFEKVFVIFQRLHARETYSGTGLGLAIVKKIIESLGGRIWVESVYGEGTTFHFTISKSIE